MSELSIPDAVKAVEVLCRIHPRGPRHLVAIDPDSGRPTARTFLLGEEERMLRWIEKRIGVENIYFHVNALRPDVRDAKAKKSDVAEAVYLHVDVDDPNARERIKAFTPQPTFIVFSGGGFQLFWRLREPCLDLDRVERCNAALAQALGGDKCHNADRIMRLADTLNLPNAKKRSAGRTVATAFVCEDLTDWSRVYSIEDFAEADPNSARNTTAKQPTELSEVAVVGSQGVRCNQNPFAAKLCPCI